MKDVKTCNQACKWKPACTMTCPTPWASFQDKCHNIHPIWKCHQECARKHKHHECHKNCPRPECPYLRDQVKASLQCHSDCPRKNEECHHACPHPMAYLGEKCDMLNETMFCHNTKCDMLN